MKLKNVAIAATALALAVGMTACGSSSSTAASSSVASSAAASSEAASSEAASSEAAEPTTAEYTVYNTTGSKVTDLCAGVHHRGRPDPGLRDPALRDHSHLPEERGRRCRRYPHRLRCTGELSLNQLASKKGCCTNAVQQPFCFKPETLRPLPPAAHRPVFCSAGACAPRCRPG